MHPASRAPGLCPKPRAPRQSRPGDLAKLPDHPGARATPGPSTGHSPGGSCCPPVRPCRKALAGSSRCLGDPRPAPVIPSSVPGGAGASRAAAVPSPPAARRASRPLTPCRSCLRCSVRNPCRPSLRCRRRCRRRRCRYCIPWLPPPSPSRPVKKKPGSETHARASHKCRSNGAGLSRTQGLVGPSPLVRVAPNRGVRIQEPMT